MTNVDHRDVALKRRRDFDADEIVRIIEPPASAVVTHIQPSRSDDGEQDIAPSDRLAYDFDEVHTEWEWRLCP